MPHPCTVNGLLNLNVVFYRMFGPRVDILTAEWHPFKEVTWVQPLMVGLSDWRGKLLELEKGVYNKSNDTDVVFIADFPGKNIAYAWSR